MRPSEHEDVRRRLESGAALVVEVLDRPYFRKFHLPGAVDIAVSGDFDAEIRRQAPDRTRPITVYRLDEACRQRHAGTCDDRSRGRGSDGRLPARAGVITAIYIVRNPDKLKHLS